MFYTNVYQRGNKIYVRGYKNGKAYEQVIKYKPYLFIPAKTGTYKTLRGQPVEPIRFDSIKEARDFVDRYSDVENFEVFGLTHWLYTYIYDVFQGDIDYDPNLLNIIFIDIECAADQGFPSIERADKEITAITIRKKEETIVFGCGNYRPHADNIIYVKCHDEAELLAKFIEVWNSPSWKPDILTGWNIEFFDVPYLINRINGVLGEKESEKLSPWKIIIPRQTEFRGKINNTYDIAGVSILDYYQLYRKFTFGNQESYKLDYIAQVELGEKKIDYSEYGSLLELYKNNYQKFIEYNIKDAILVQRLDDKLKFLEQVMAFAYDAKVNYNDTLTTVRPWDVIIHNYLLDRRTVIPQMKSNKFDKPLVGGYVKIPKPGFYKWVVSFDLNSLYPHLIMQYNISPEKFQFRIAEDCFPTIDEILMSTDSILPGAVKEACYTANGCRFSKDSQGFLPALMEKMYNDRVSFKKKMLEAKQRLEHSHSFEDEKLVARYHNMQLAKKIQLNSAYGALANLYFRWFNFDLAEAVTTSGQLSIRWIERDFNKFMNKMLKTEGVDYIIASDTDSIYVEMDALVKQLPPMTDEEIVKILDQFCEEKVQPFIDKSYERLARYMNAYQQKMKMKRETIANKGIWTAKKHYILNAWNVEGVQYEHPKLKITGIEAVRSSTPHVCRQKIKEALNIIMNKDQTELQKFIADFKEEFLKLPFEDVAKPSSMNGLNEYRDYSNIYAKKTPIHVKGALIFNHLLVKYGIKNIPPIYDGDKVKFCYLTLPNPIHDTVITCPDELPPELKLDKYVDRELQFEKVFLKPLKSITDVMGWSVEKRASLEDFFS